jgi:acyl-CoA synthetase (AMP-forming)/AMP-acid ligase II
MNIIEILQERAASQPQAPAIIDRCGVTTFAALEQASARAATLLWQSGLRPGHTVLIFQPMSAELYVALSAVFRLGLIAMFLDPGQGRRHIEYCCSLHEPQALIASSKAHLLRLISPTLRRIRAKFVIGPALPGAISWRQAGALAPYPEIISCQADTPALLTFTSGSTGRPKVALRSHGFLLAQHRVLAQTLGLSNGDLDLTTMPIVALANLASGVTCLIPPADLRAPGLIDPAPVVAQMQRSGVASTVASPALLARLAGYCLAQQLTLPRLRKVFTGGGPVWPGLLARLQQVAPQAALVAVYGSSEAEPIATSAYHQLRSEEVRAMNQGCGLLAGKPVPAIQLRIIPDEGERPLGSLTPAEFAALCRGPGQIGEIIVSGDHVLSGQSHDPHHIDVSGSSWQRTGDAGYVDDQGRLWLLGRCAARLDDGQGRLYPFAVEGVALQQPGVRRAALIHHQQQRLLIVEPEPDLVPDLIALKKSLAWARLADIRLCRQLPVDRRHNAKIDYPALQQRLNKGRQL